MIQEAPKIIEEVAIVGTKPQVAEWLQKDLKQGYELVAIEPVRSVHSIQPLERLRVKPLIVK